MPDKHKIKLFSHFKQPSVDEELTPSTSNQSQSHSVANQGRKFLGFHIGKHDSQDSLTSPTLTNSGDHHHGHHGHHHHGQAGQHHQHNILGNSSHSSNPDSRPDTPPNSNISPLQQIPIQSPQPNVHVPLNKEDSNHTFMKSNSMIELKRLFKPTKKNSNPRKNEHPSYTSNIHSPPAIASPSAGVSYNTASAQHSREPSSTSLATLINQTSSQLLNRASHGNGGILHGKSHNAAPFTDDDSPLVKKYGKVGKELGSGAGGSVKLIIRPSDSKTFAVKEFRPRRNTESLKDYTRKCTAEYCIGSTLKHPNIIKTIDIIHENNRYFEIMEYAPIDFFAVVMSGEMSRQEINCCLKQILEGVGYLHSLGLAHRDLKLDNCVLTTNGILKIIDFGSAVIFKYPYDQFGNSKDSIHHCHGIVGSDPYLAPEVLKNSHSYNPQPVDLWSIAIIYCCMTLKRFPWKIPNPEKDNSFKLYAMEDDNWHDYPLSNECHKLLLQQRKLKNMIVRLNKKKKALAEQQAQLDREMVDSNHETDDHDMEITNENENPNEVEGESLAQNDQINEDKDDKMNTDEQQTTKKDDKLVQLQNVDILSEDQLQSILNGLKEIDQKLEDYEKRKTEMKNKFNESRKINQEVTEQQETKDEPNQDAKEDSGKKKQSHHKQIHGPYRLMRLLPHASRPIISRMLQVDPKKRASLEEILQDEWIRDIQCCTLKKVPRSSDNIGANFEEDEDDILVKGNPPHDHTLVLDNQ
ncbi:Pkinase-domain-containing protein, partial [Hyphopichia burtonii NRRL Y-1933]